MRRQLVASVILSLFVSLIGSPVKAEAPSQSCLAAPDQACLLAWAWEETIATPAGGGEDPRKLSDPIMTELLELETAAEIFELVNAVPNELQRYYWLTFVARPSVVALPDYKQAVQTSLQGATSKALSSDQYFFTWAALVGVAGKIGLDDEAQTAFRQVLDVDRADIEASDAKVRATIVTALSLKDYEAFRDLISLTSEPAGFDRFSNLRAWWQADPSIADLLEYKQAVLAGLKAATGRLLSRQQPSNWGQFVELAKDIGLGGEARSAFQQGVVFLRSDVGDNDRVSEQRAQGVISLALRLKDYGTVREWLGRLNPEPDWRDRESSFRALWKADPAIADLPEFKDAVRTGLQLTSGRLPSGGVFDFGTWVGVVKLANEVGMSQEALSALRRAVDIVRSPVADRDEEKDSKIGIAIRAAAILDDLATARELLGRMTSADLIEQAEAMIANAEKHPGADPVWPGPSDFDIMLSQREFAAALLVASSPADYANLALQAAIAQDMPTAKAALTRFEQQKASGELKEGGVACELKRGFTHLLLSDEFDVAPLIKDAEAWVEARPGLEMTGMLFWWDISALKMLSGEEQAVLDEAAGADAASKAGGVGGAAAVALGIGGGRAWPYMRDAMGLVAQVPTPYERASTLELMARVVGAHNTTTGCR